MSKNINSFYYCYHDFGSRRGTKGYELKKKKKKKKKNIKKKNLNNKSILRASARISILARQNAPYCATKG